jgi:uncharacterized protein YqhQ
LSKKPQALVGGQAVIEGVMMRSPKGIATAVRRPNGTIAVRYRDYTPVAKRSRVLGFPIVRGAVTLVEAIVIGTQSLFFSAEEASREEGQEIRRTPWWEKAAYGGTIVLSFAIGLGLFFYLPFWLADFTRVENGFLFNLVAGVIRLAVFFAYLYLITRWKEMRRVFQYHGAEHMTIFNYEAELPITVENARGNPRLHPRCGTSFLFFVMVVAIFVFALAGRPETAGERLIRLLFVPLIGGLSYEVIRLSAKIDDTWLGRVLAAPGKALQLMTTGPPDDSQLEVGVVAIRTALEGQPPEQAVSA